jgi:CheY-like chemotaxis protein
VNEEMGKKHRKRQRNAPEVIAEQAAAYGVSLPPEHGRFLSPNDIGKILNVTGEAVKQWIYQRRLPAVKLHNGYWKVKISDLEAFWRARYDVGHRHVLVITSKDDPTLDVIQAVEQLGCRPITATNYADALLKSLDHHPAMFIIDCSAHEVTPWKLAEKLRDTKALRGVPILLMANSDLSEADAARALELSAQGFLKRHSSAEILKQEIDRILNRGL